MKASGCGGGGGGGGGGGVTTVELVAKLERETCGSSFHPQKDNNRNVNGSRPAFWNKISDTDLYRESSQLSSLGNGKANLDHDTGTIPSSFDLGSVPEAKQSLRKSGKAARSNGNSSRRSRVAHMEASLNATGSVDMNDLPKELGSYPGKCDIVEKIQTATQKTNLSAKRSDKRNGKVPKTKCDSFSVKAGLSSFSSAAGGNNIFGVSGLKHEIYDFAKHVDELPLNELLDGSYKCPQSVKVKGKKTGNLNENILHSVREACSILQLQKTTQPQNMAAGDGTYHQNASSCLPNSSTSEASRSDDNKGDAVDPSSCNKVEGSCSGLVNDANALEFLFFAPKDVLGRLALPPPKDLDLLLLDSVKSISTSKGTLDPRLGKPVHSRVGLPIFPWSHISGGHFKADPDVIKLTPRKSTCHGRWVKMRKSATTLGDTTTFIVDLESLTYDQNLVPLGCQPPGQTEKEKSSLSSVHEKIFEPGVAPSWTHTIASKIPAEHSPGLLAAAQTLCDIASHFRNQYQNGTMIWPKKPSQKSMKLKSDEKLEKALFTIPSSRTVGPSNLANCAGEPMMHTPKRLRLSATNSLTKSQPLWSTATPQSSRSSPGKPYKDAIAESKHHDSSPMKRSFKPPKI